jgi:putative OPT family oligopeptide transporter
VTRRGTYRELTPQALIGGVLVGLVLNMGIVFAGLQIGFTIVGSTVGAIIGFGILRGILRKGSILEVNVFQTIASSVNTVNSGIIFTIPVLFLLERNGARLSDGVNWSSVVMAGVAGSLLGVVMIIPLRRQIIDLERLRFPSAIAVGTILRSPGAGIEKARLLTIGIVVAAVFTGLTLDWTGAGAVIGDSFHLGEALGLPAGIRLVFAASLLSLGAGFIAGRPGLAILYGTLLNFWVLIPACVWLGWVEPNFAAFKVFGDDYEAADALANGFRNFTANKVGIGMILGGAIAGIVIALPALKAALASLRGGGDDAGGRREEVSMNVVGTGTLIGGVLFFAAAKISGGDAVSWVEAGLVTAAGITWLWLASLVVAQTTGRTDWSPLSGLSLIAIAILMGILGPGETSSILPAVTLGAAVCVATSMCADMMADLKTGYLVGGRPLKQQIAQIATCWIGPGVSLLVVFVLWEAYAFGPEQALVMWERAVEAGPEVQAAYAANGGSDQELAAGIPVLGAPQAGALQAAIEIVQSGDIPLGKYLTGALLGLVVSLLVSPGLGVMIGLSLYLPFKYMIVFGLGGLISMFVTKKKGPRFVEDKGVPLAAGLIVGDALVNITNAVVKVAQSL